MNSLLLENNYLVIPEFINPNRARNLSKEFIEYCKENELEGDSQVPSSYSKYDYISFLELLCELTPTVSSTIEETVLPTYSYARVYKKGSVLSPHTDREACEISITINLDCDIPWDISLTTPKGERKDIKLNPGDAMIYFGCKAPHWREEYRGEYCSQVFLHYVRSRGPYSCVYFDKKKYNECVKEPVKKTIETPTLIVKEPEKSKSTLDDYIKVFYSALTSDQCDLILNEYVNSNEWEPTKTGSNGEVNPNIRNCETIGISLKDVIERNADIRSKIDQIIFEQSDMTIRKYIEYFPHCNLISDSGYDLLKYDTGGYYKLHTDSFKQIPRTLSCSFNLNDDYEGGQFAFFDKEIIIAAPKGSAIVFPSNFMYPHEILEVTKGTRYSIVTWFT